MKRFAHRHKQQSTDFAFHAAFYLGDDLRVAQRWAQFEAAQSPGFRPAVVAFTVDLATLFGKHQAKVFATADQEWREVCRHHISLFGLARLAFWWACGFAPFARVFALWYDKLTVKQAHTLKTLLEASWPALPQAAGLPVSLSKSASAPPWKALSRRTALSRMLSPVRLELHDLVPQRRAWRATVATAALGSFSRTDAEDVAEGLEHDRNDLVVTTAEQSAEWSEAPGLLDDVSDLLRRAAAGGVGDGPHRVHRDVPVDRECRRFVGRCWPRSRPGLEACCQR
jgi:hypothetical protein